LETFEHVHQSTVYNGGYGFIVDVLNGKEHGQVCELLINKR
jgi:hypothetical protein